MNASERERFERDVLPHMKAAYTLARWLCGNGPDAEDAVQEAFLRAVKFFGQFRGDNARAWLLTIVRRACYATWEGRGTKTVGLDEHAAEVEDEKPGPEDLLLQQATRAMMVEALEGLSLEFREAIVLREIEGLSYREMAEVLQVPLGTVMSRLARARSRLRQGLETRARGGAA